jgi:hypothetical protein
VIAATCSGSGDSRSNSLPSASPIAPRSSEPPGQIRVDTPPMRDGKAAKDWRKLVEKLQRGDIGEAREKLDEWERKYGATSETESLRTQLENVPDHDDDRGRGRGRKRDD